MGDLTNSPYCLVNPASLNSSCPYGTCSAEMLTASRRSYVAVSQYRRVEVRNRKYLYPFGESGSPEDQLNSPARSIFLTVSFRSPDSLVGCWFELIMTMGGSNERLLNCE